MRSTWLIEPTFAEAHIPYINSYLAGTLPKQLLDNEESEDEANNGVSRIGFALAVHAGNAGAADGSPATQTATADRRYSLDDPELPDNSVFILDIRGAIFKESTCCSTGTEEYCSMLERAYANEKIIGIVALIDSPGGQLSGTPTLYDALRNPAKPTVSVINEGLMASAAYWLACGSDDIYATQKSDQVGSIGVFVQMEDRTKAREAAGVKLITVYSDRSSQKNKPYRDALAGDDTLLREDLNQAADLFREAVEAGRGARLKNGKKGTADDVFEGGLFYASKAIQLGLIDGFGNLNTAIARVSELHQARSSQQNGSLGSSGSTVRSEGETPGLTTSLAASQASSTTTRLAPAEGAADAPALGDNQPESAPAEEAPSDQLLTQNPTDPMFGFTKLPALAAVKGVAAADITAAQIDAINAELAAEGYNIGAVSQADFTAAQTLQNELTTAKATIKTRDEEIARLGKQPGVMGTKVEKIDETISTDSNPLISETDAELAELKKGKSGAK